MRPVCSILSKTDPDDHSCQFTFDVGYGPTVLPMTNSAAHALMAALERAYREGRTDGKQAMIDEVRATLNAAEARG